MTSTNPLLHPLTIGPITTSSRIIMGPLGSYLANSSHVLPPTAISYYGDRSLVRGTLIIAEATFISHAASGTPEQRAGIWSAEQIAAWKAVVERVHAQGSFIFLQLWALGRQADGHVKRREGSGDVVSASAVPESKAGEVPRELREEEIWGYIGDYGRAARNAVELAGFDGVELHGGNGSLIDQFTQDVCNRRTDGWGGSVERRNRFALEVTKAVAEAVGAERVGFRISPFSTYGGMGSKNAVEQFSNLLESLKELKIGYLHLVESRIAGRVDVEAGEPLDPFIELWGDASPIVLAGGYTPESAREALSGQYKGKAIAIAFGRAFVTNPDLVQRLKDGVQLREG